MLFSFTKQEAPIVITWLFLKELKIRVNKSSVQKSLEDHPEYPSLLAISDSLTEWHVPNISRKIAKEDYNQPELDFPFLAHSNANGGTIMLIHDIKERQVIYSDERQKKSSMSEEEFLKRWSGIILEAGVDEKSGESNYGINRGKDLLGEVKLPLLLLSIVVLVLLSLDIQNISISYSIVFVLKLIGITTSILLLMHSIDANNPFVQNLCSLGSKNGCNAVLKSDAAKVTSWLSWSEIGFFYFAGSLLSLIFVPSSLTLLAWLNLFALPYTVYSIGYQYRNKNWCVLCSTVQVLLWLEFITNITLSTSAFSFNFLALNSKEVVLIFLGFILPILIWASIKTFLLKSVQFKPLKHQLKKFKYNSELFDQVLKNQPRYAIPTELMPVVLGNPEAETVITMVSNPFCGPCSKAHQTIDEWLSYRNDFQLKIIFTTADHDDDVKTKVSRHVSALTTLNDPNLVERALNDWYAQSAKKYESWAAKYPISFNGEMNAVTEKQKAWCDMAEITFTPTILINGYKLPAPYRLEDIKYLL